MTWSRARSEELMRLFLIPEDSADPKELKRRRIVAAAAELFERFGYRKTSIDDVARSAGIAKGTVYLYFKNKADLLMHAIVAEKARFVPRFFAVMEEADPRERLRHLIRLTFETINDMPLTAQLTDVDGAIHAVLAQVDPGLLATMEEQQRETYRHLLLPLLGDSPAAVAAADERAAALQTIFISSHRLVSEAERAGLDAARFAAVIADALVDGFAAPLEPGQD